MEFGWASSSLIALVPFLLFVLIRLKSQEIRKGAEIYSHIPGPKKLPLIGNLHLMLRTLSPPRMLRDLSAKYGPLMHLQLGELNFLVISSVEFAKELLTTHDVNFANRPPILTSEILGYNYSDLGFAPYGDYWRRVKKIFTLQMLSAKRVRSFRPIREEENKKLTIFLGASETTTTVIEWAMSHMIKDPSILKTTQDEVRRVFDGDKGGYVDEEKFKQLEYLKLVIKETLRLHPPVPFLVPRINNQQCEINGFKIPAKTRVMINVWALGREPMCWGDDADQFKPERFGVKGMEMDYKGKNYEYLPFGSGRRVCPGISFGMASVEFTLATLLYHFDWKIPEGNNNENLDMTEEFGLCVKKTPFASHSHYHQAFK